MKRFLLHLAALVPLTVAMVACNTDYNFDNVSLEVTVGDTEGITIPLGSTEQITVASLLDDQGIETDQNGYYGYTLSDQLAYTAAIGTIDPVVITAPTIDAVTVTLAEGISTSIPAVNKSTDIDMPSGISTSLTIPATSPLVGITIPLTSANTVSETVSLTLPEQIKSVKEIIFGNDLEGSAIEVTFDLGGLADVTEGRVMNTFSIALPAGFEIAKDNTCPLNDYAVVDKANDSTTPNRYTATNYPMTDGQLTISFLIKRIDASTFSTTNSVLDIAADIAYDFDFEATIKAGTVGTTLPYVTATAAMEVGEVTVVTNAVSHKVEFSEEVGQSVELPEEIARIDYISVNDGSDGIPTLDLALTLANAPIDNITLKDLSLSLPSFIDIDTPEGWTLEGSAITRESLTINNNATTSLLSLPIKGLHNITIEDAVANLVGQVAISATAGLDDGQELTINPGSISSITVTPSVSIDTIGIDEVEGIIDPDFGSLIEPIEVDLSDLTSALGEEFELDLNLASPTIQFSITNPIGVGIEAVVNIDGYKGTQLAKSISTPTITINPAVGTNATTTEVIIRGEAGPKPDNYTEYVVEGLCDLINSLPERLVVTVDMATDKSTTHKLVLQEAYNFNVDYSVAASLRFDDSKDGHISYSTLVEDIELSQLQDIDIDVDSLTLHVKAASTLPIDVVMRAEMLDSNAQPVQGLTCTTTGVIEGSASATEENSEIAIGIKITPPYISSDIGPSTVGELLAQLNKVRCTFEGTTLAGGGLKPEQYLQVELSLCIDSGITVDLETLLPEDEKPNEGEQPEAADK